MFEIILILVMLILFGSVMLILFGLTLIKYTERFDLIGYIIVILSSLIFIIGIIDIPIIRFKKNAEITEFKALKSSVKVSRERSYSLENATLQLKIIESNEWLAYTKYLNESVFDIFIPDEIDNLTPIK